MTIRELLEHVGIDTSNGVYVDGRCVAEPYERNTMNEWQGQTPKVEYVDELQLGSEPAYDISSTPIYNQLVSERGYDRLLGEISAGLTRLAAKVHTPSVEPLSQRYMAPGAYRSGVQLGRQEQRSSLPVRKPGASLSEIPRELLIGDEELFDNERLAFFSDARGNPDQIKDKFTARVIPIRMHLSDLEAHGVEIDPDTIDHEAIQRESSSNISYDELVEIARKEPLWATSIGEDTADSLYMKPSAWGSNEE